MKITTKINLLTSAWVLLTMILINLVVFFLFIKTTINMEENMQYRKSADILVDLSSIQSSSNINRILKNYLTIHSYIRIIQPNNKITHEVGNDSLLLKKIKGKYVEKKHAQTHLISAENGEEQVLVVRVPIKSGNHIIGSLEIGERLLGLEMREEILRAILGFCTVLAFIFSLFGEDG